MSPSQRRIAGLAAVFVLGLGGLLGVLAWLMLDQHEAWLVRSYRNRWIFKDTPTRRGAILDRNGELVLAWDRPEFELQVYYLQFRRRHPVGAAVHGANLLRPALGVRDSFEFTADPKSGARAAFDILARTRVAALMGEASPLADDVRRDVGFYGASLFAVLSGQSMARVRAQWRAALKQNPLVTLRAAVDTDLDLATEFSAYWQELATLSASLSSEPGEALLDRLGEWRLESNSDRAAEARGDAVAVFEERALRRVARAVPFDLACGLRVHDRNHAGLRLLPAVRRERDVGPSLRSVLGGVARLNRKDLWDPYKEDSQILELERFEGLVPRDLFDADGFEQELRNLARDHMEWTLQNTGRVGSSGVELDLDRRLAGAPGIRLVERDRDTREMTMARQLDISPGEDVRLTIDLKLQNAAERIVERVYDDLYARLPGAAATAEAKLADMGNRAPDPENEARIRKRSERALETALVVVDGRSGELLALTAWPPRIEEDVDLDGDPATPKVTRDWPRPPAGLMWRTGGDIGSLAKPFMYLQHLELAARYGLRSPSEFRPCPGGRNIRFDRIRRRLSCLGAHGTVSQDGAEAVCHSCNMWFFEVSRDIGDAGIRNALERVGLVAPQRAELFGGGSVVANDAAGSVPIAFPGFPEGTWTSRIHGLPGRAYRAPMFRGRRTTPMKAIGYGTEASPVWIARAYAALATGALPSLSLVRGAPVDRVNLTAQPENLHRVRLAMRSVIERGTARKIDGLQRPGVFGKTGTAEVSSNGDNNAWFAGWLDPGSEDAVLPVFVAVAYFVPDRVHGGDTAGRMVGDLLDVMANDPELAARYWVPRGTR